MNALVVGFLLAICCASASTEISEYSMRIAHGKVAIDIELQDYEGRLLPRTGWWGHDLETPKKIIRAFEVSYDGQPVFMPISAYFSLSDPNLISLNVDSEEYDVHLRGSDTSGCYKAILRFKKNVLLSTKVFGCAFPDERWEVTEYSFIDQESQR